MVRRLAGRQRRSFIPTLLDGREIGPTTNDNYGDYSSRAVNQLIDKALAEQDPDRRAAIWGDADRQAMADAAWAPRAVVRTAYLLLVLPRQELDLFAVDRSPRLRQPLARPVHP